MKKFIAALTIFITLSSVANAQYGTLAPTAPGNYTPPPGSPTTPPPPVPNDPINPTNLPNNPPVISGPPAVLPPPVNTPYCNQFRAAIDDLSNSLMEYYYLFNTGQTAIAGIQAEVDSIKSEINMISAQIIMAELNGQPVPQWMREAIQDKFDEIGDLYIQISSIKDILANLNRSIEEREKIIAELWALFKAQGC